MRSAVAILIVALLLHVSDAVAVGDKYFHVDDFAGLGGGSFGKLVPISGNKSLWGGARPSAIDPELSTYLTLPGYGDNWDECWESCWFDASDSVDVSYLICWDTEPLYDYVYFDYYDAGWITLRSYNGQQGFANELIRVPTIPALGAIKFRFRIDSDGAWSDQDGNWDTDGACIVDSMSVLVGGVVIDFQDFETEAVGDQVTTNGKWHAGEQTCGGATVVDTCSGFETNTAEGWTASAATIQLSSPGAFGTSSYHLRCGDQPSPPSSAIIAPTTFTGDWSQAGGICYDYRVTNSGWGDGRQVHPGIFFSTDPTGVGGIRAHFDVNPQYQATSPAGINPGWHHYIAPIHPVDPGSPLPSNDYGQWMVQNPPGTPSADPPTDWNYLITNVQRVYFLADIAGSPSQTEDFGIDNICIGTCPDTIRCYPHPPGMRGWWAADGNPYDLSGYGNGGTYPGPYSSGKVGSGSFWFDPITSLAPVEVPNSPTLNFGTPSALGRGNFSIDAWVRLAPPMFPQFLTGGPVVYKFNTPVNDAMYHFYIVDGTLAMEVQTPSGSVSALDGSGATVPVGEWTHIAVTIDRAGGSASGVGRFYIDGVETSSFPLTLPGDLTGVGPLWIGQSYGGYFNGEIDEVELFARALLPQEVLRIAQAGSSGKCKGLEYASLDCNGNGVPDILDIANGTSSDTNGNDNPDECEGGPATGTSGETITRVALHPNVPNPFNPATTITYDLVKKGPVELAIYDVRGKLVTKLVTGTEPAGSHRIEWNGTDALGQMVPSGVYFCRLTAGGSVVTRKLVLLK